MNRNEQKETKSYAVVDFCFYPHKNSVGCFLIMMVPKFFQEGLVLNRKRSPINNFSSQDYLLKSLKLIFGSLDWEKVICKDGSKWEYIS